MATLRKRFLVAWDDRPPVEIRTTARDIVNVNPDNEASPAMATFALIHGALVREGHDVPPIEEWIDVVDEVEEVATEVAGIEGPTRLAVSDGEPSQLPA